MKYAALLGILIIGTLLFVNRDKMFVKVPTAGETVSQITSVQKKGYFCDGINCTCKGHLNCTCAHGDGWYRCWDNENATTTATTTEKFYKLKLLYKVGNNGSAGESVSKGKITPEAPGKYLTGTTAVLTAEPIKGFKVVWDGPCASAGNVCKIKMDSDKTVNVSFVQKSGWKCSISVLGGFECNKEW